MNAARLAADCFPCPFCHGARVRVTGQTKSFVHYICSDCAEVWTAMAFRPRTASLGWSDAASSRSKPNPA